MEVFRYSAITLGEKMSNSLRIRSVAYLELSGLSLSPREALCPVN